MTYKALDIAHKLIKKAESEQTDGGELLTNLKLQKLLYYQQGYHLAFFNKPLFADVIEAWIYGPVVPSVYDSYSKQGAKALVYHGKCIALKDEEEQLFSSVYNAYCDFSALGLMHKTHLEEPWKNSVPHNRGTEISNKNMSSFFKRLIEKDGKK
jgi:uncharacterized phage-associated protein